MRWHVLNPALLVGLPLFYRPSLIELLPSLGCSMVYPFYCQV